jgi:hypothetical protein
MKEGLYRLSYLFDKTTPATTLWQIPTIGKKKLLEKLAGMYGWEEKDIDRFESGGDYWLSLGGGTAIEIQNVTKERRRARQRKLYDQIDEIGHTAKERYLANVDWMRVLEELNKEELENYVALLRQVGEDTMADTIRDGLLTWYK